MPLRSPAYLGTIPTRPISQELQFVYLLPMRLKLSWNTLQKELVGLSHSHGVLLFQVVGEAADYCHGSLILSPAPHFPWLSLKEHFPALPAPSTTFVTGRNNQTCLGFSKVIVCLGREVDLTWIVDLKLFKHILWMSPALDTSPATSWNTLEIL